MTVFFVLVVLAGMALLVADRCAKAASAAPSMYRSDDTGAFLILIGVIGALCIILFG